MSNRKPAAASKRARRPKAAARAQRNKQALVRSPKDNPLRSVAARPTESPLEVHDHSKQETAIVENWEAGLQDSFSQTMRDNNPKKGFNLSLPMANMQAYHAKLLEVTQANMQFALEFSQRLATTRSPFELLAVIAEFTGRRIVMNSKELAAYSFWRIDASRSLTGPPQR